MKEIDLVFRTAFAELIQRSLDASFQSDFSLRGRFVLVSVKDRSYWYFDETVDGRIKRKYVGPEYDPALTERVRDFQGLKAVAKAQRKIVATLTRQAALPAPERLTGDLINALADAGVFRLRAVLIGTVAYECYSGFLGVRLPSATLQTGDTDFALFHSIGTTLDNQMPPILDILRSVDSTFHEIPHQVDGRKATQFINATRYKVEFLTPNWGSDEFEAQPTTLPTLGGAAVQPIRFLDFLIHEPVRSVLLHGKGISVTMPAPERYAIHKLIVASRRNTSHDSGAKRDKDIHQVSALVEAFTVTRRQVDLATVFVEAWKRGPSWIEAITIGVSYMQPKARRILKDALLEGLDVIDEDLDGCQFLHDVSDN